MEIAVSINMSEEVAAAAPEEQPKPEEPGKPRQKRANDFDINPDSIGEGAFGKVYEVTDKETHVKYAMKVLSKLHIEKEKKIAYVKLERDVMAKLHHRNIVRLVLTFQDQSNLYYVVELAPNGDLQKVLNQKYALDIPCTMVITGQLLLAIAHMHKNRVIHRDLKPENILLDSENRVKVTDFGTAKMFPDDQPFVAEKGSFVGSADYVCPETLNETPLGPASDLWSFGCILYCLLVGVPPFHADSMYAIFEKIKALDYKIPDFVPPHAKDLISKLLVLDPEKRIGYGEYETDYQSIREHAFYSFVQWDTLPEKPMPAFESFLPALSARAERSPQGGLEKSESADVIETNEKASESLVPELLVAKEESIYEGNIVKRRRLLSVKKRRLVLTNKPRLFYVDMSTKSIKGEIPLSKELKVVLEKGKKWKIEVPGRVYDLSSETPNAPGEWKAAIEKVIKDMA